MGKKNEIDIKVNYVPDTGAVQAATKRIQELKFNFGGKDIKAQVVDPVQKAMKKLNQSLNMGVKSKEMLKAFDGVNNAIRMTERRLGGMAEEAERAFKSPGNQAALKSLNIYEKKVEEIQRSLAKWNKDFGKKAATKQQKKLSDAGIMGGAKEVNKIIKLYKKAVVENKNITSEMKLQYKAAKEHRAWLDAKHQTPKMGIESSLAQAKTQVDKVLTEGAITPEAHSSKLKEISNATDILRFSTGQLTEEYEEYNRALNDQNVALEKNKKKMGKMKDIIAGTFLGTGASNLLQDALYGGVEFFKQFDATLTRTTMVTGMSREAVLGLTSSYSDLASELSSTIQEVAEAQLVFFQQGLSAQESLKMTEASIAISKTGGIAAEEAANRLTSAMRGYKIAATEAMDVADKMSALDAAAASSVDELTIAMQKSASQAKMAGLSLDTYMAYLSTMQEVTREAPDGRKTTPRSNI